MPELLEKVAVTSGTAVALTTTSETVILSSGPCKVPYATCQVVIRAWAQLTTGAGTTAVTPRIRRGTAVGGDLVGEGNPEQVKAAAGSTERLDCMATEQRANVSEVEYSLTLEQTGATADGSSIQAGIEVEVLNG